MRTFVVFCYDLCEISLKNKFWRNVNKTLRSFCIYSTPNDYFFPRWADAGRQVALKCIFTAEPQTKRQACSIILKFSNPFHRNKSEGKLASFSKLAEFYIFPLSSSPFIEICKWWKFEFILKVIKFNCVTLIFYQQKGKKTYIPSLLLSFLNIQ
jgi:hypothetical protein